MAGNKGRKVSLRLLSWILILGGVAFLSLCARDLITPWLAQSRAEAALERSLKAEVPPAPALSRNKPSAIRPVRHIDLGGAVALLSIPRLKSRWFVFEGTNQADLRRGPGHMDGTVMPGEQGNCVIAGHRDTQFRALKNIRPGDDVVLETQDGKFRYRVTGLSIVSPDDTRSLDPSPHYVLHLITCYPFYYIGHAPKRFVVQAELEGKPESPHS